MSVEPPQKEPDAELKTDTVAALNENICKQLEKLFTKNACLCDNSGLTIVPCESKAKRTACKERTMGKYKPDEPKD